MTPPTLGYFVPTKEAVRSLPHLQKFNLHYPGMTPSSLVHSYQR